jgi:hypothetical protein
MKSKIDWGERGMRYECPKLYGMVRCILNSIVISDEVC